MLVLSVPLMSYWTSYRTEGSLLTLVLLILFLFFSTGHQIFVLLPVMRVGNTLWGGELEVVSQKPFWASGIHLGLAYDVIKYEKGALVTTGSPTVLFYSCQPVTESTAKDTRENPNEPCLRQVCQLSISLQRGSSWLCGFEWDSTSWLG